MQPVPITTNVVSSNPDQARCTRYNIFDKCRQWLATGRWFSKETKEGQIMCFYRYGYTLFIMFLKKVFLFFFCIIKRRSKQWWSTIPPISTRRSTTSHLISLNTQINHDICSLKWRFWLGTRDHCGEIKPVNRLPKPSCLDNYI